LAELKFDIFSHFLYSSDLIFLDFHLFAKPKIFLVKKRFKSNEKVVKIINDYFEDLKEKNIEYSKPIFKRESNIYRNVGRSVLDFEGIILKNKAYNNL